MASCVDTALRMFQPPETTRRRLFDTDLRMSRCCGSGSQVEPSRYCSSGGWVEPFRHCGSISQVKPSRHCSPGKQVELSRHCSRNHKKKGLHIFLGCHPHSMRLPSPPCIYMKKSAWSFFLCIHMLKVIKSWRQLTSYPGPPSFLSLAVSDERLWD